ncbi:3-deoxy-manno-octulosonate cytidylyltransferase [Akkermansiaceae bacterium]|nr:3-deoxy-manno-octulosonate cytidylyltransferase [Akkermansiaceae bacterium]
MQYVVTKNEQKNMVLGVIPARWASTRFPHKMLHPIAGKPLVQHVWERCQGCKNLDQLVIATDEVKIYEAAKSFGAEVVMTSADHPSGTDRIAEAIKHFPEATQIINIQGDEPTIEPLLIDQLASELQSHPEVGMVTAANIFTDQALLDDPNVVKCVLNLKGEALYFSRSALPFQRSHSTELNLLRHKGIYGYQTAFIKQFVNWTPSALEIAEGLEQLRALENGAKIKVIITDDTSGGIDTLEQAIQLEHNLLNN